MNYKGLVIVLYRILVILLLLFMNYQLYAIVLTNYVILDRNELIIESILPAAGPPLEDN